MSNRSRRQGSSYLRSDPRRRCLCEGRPVTLPASRPFPRSGPARAHAGFFLEIRSKARARPHGLTHKPGVVDVPQVEISWNDTPLFRFVR
ncbi:unnamed protein product [Caenorhabditis auriculariae]|uniref:Uncharacterized protein n=1 Tax=Caenorhabditis auriculariae TaxID=2777116 RepID=A0A8S1HJG7_9PELO|nr:unnamed protein product [Caenorhabditis auriculariae]